MHWSWLRRCSLKSLTKPCSREPRLDSSRRGSRVIDVDSSRKLFGRRESHPSATQKTSEYLTLQSRLRVSLIRCILELSTKCRRIKNLGKKNLMTELKAAIVKVDNDDKFVFMHVECFDSFACGESADFATLAFVDIKCDLCGERLADEYREVDVDEFDAICTARASASVSTEILGDSIVTKFFSSIDSMKSN